MNESINEIVDEHGHDLEALKLALVGRDEELLDQLRAAAAQMGLRPAMVQVILMQMPIGNRPDDDVLAYVTQQAQVEQAEMHAEFHRMTGTECQCARPDPS